MDVDQTEVHAKETGVGSLNIQLQDQFLTLRWSARQTLCDEKNINNNNNNATMLPESLSPIRFLDRRCHSSAVILF